MNYYRIISIPHYAPKAMENKATYHVRESGEIDPPSYDPLRAIEIHLEELDSELQRLGLNIFIGWLFDEDSYEDDPTLINVTDLLIHWHEDDLEEVLSQYDASTIDQLRDKLTYFIPIPRTDRAIYKEQ